MSDTDVAGGLDLSTYTGPPASEFPATANFAWQSYEVTGGAVGGVPSATDLELDIKEPTTPLTDYVVFVQLPPGESLDADGSSFQMLTDSQMEGLGMTDEIVFNWTVDSKSDTVGTPNPQFGVNIDPCTIEFTDGASGTPVYVVGDDLFVELDDGVANANSAAADTVTVTLTNVDTGETEDLLLTETGNDTGIFVNTVGFPTTDSGSTGNNDGTLNVQFGATVTVSFATGGVGVVCMDTYVFPVEPSLLKEVDQSTADPGDPLLYTIHPGYPGFGVLTNVVVTDTVPANTTISGSPGQGGVHDGGSPGVVTWNLGSATAGTDGFVAGTPGGPGHNYEDDFDPADDFDYNSTGGPGNTGADNSSGTTAWSSEWTYEVLETGGDSKTKFNDDLEVKAKDGANGDFAWAARVVPLGGQASADVQIVTAEAIKLDGGLVLFEARYSSSAPWVTVYSFVDGEEDTDFGTQVIDSSVLGGTLTNTAEIRFRTTSSGSGENKIKLEQVVINGTLVAVPELTTSLNAAPSILTDGETLTVKVELGADLADVLGAAPAGLIIDSSNANGATLTPVSGPVPATADVLLGTTQTFTYTYTVDTGSSTAPGTFSFQASGTGNGGSAIWATGTSNSVIVSPALTYSVTVDAGFEGLISNIATISDISGLIPPTDSNEVITVVGDPDGSLSGTVWVDIDDNGTGDVPLSGVTLTLKDENGNDVDGNQVLPGIQPTTTTTDGSGYYIFTNLPAGNYIVVETQPGDYFSVSDIDGANNNIIGDENPIVVISGFNTPGNDFIEEPPGPLTKFVDKETAAPGDSLLYTLRPRYDGSEGLLNVTVTDAVPANTTILGLPGQGGSHDGGSPGTVTWALGSVDPGSGPVVIGAPGGSVTLNAVADTFVWEGDPNTVWDTSVYGETFVEIYGDPGDLEYALFEWDVSGIPAGAVVTSATMSFFEERDPDGPLTASMRQVTSAWAEATTTWNNQPTVAAGSLGSLVTSNDGYNTVASTPALVATVQSWLDTPASNFGVRMDAADDGGFEEITSREAGSNQPQLTVVYSGMQTTNTAIASPTLVTGGDTVTLSVELAASGAVANVSPGAPVIDLTGANGATLTLQTGPVPASASITAGGSQIFTFTYLVDTSLATAPGSFQFDVDGSGDAGATLWGTATSNSVLVSPDLTYSVTIDPAFQGLIPNIASISDTSGAIPPTDSNQVLTEVLAPKSSAFADFIADNAALFGLDDNSIPGVPEIDPLTGSATGSTDTDGDDFGGGGGLTGNADGDIFNELLEFALCFDPASGAKVFPSGTRNEGFHLELNGSSLDAKYHKPDGVTDVTYELEQSIDGQTWTTFTGISPVESTGPYIGSVTVSYEGINVSTPGLLRLKVTGTGALGSTISEVTGPVGWQMATITDFCQTYADPLLEPCLVTGTIDAATTATRVLDLAEAAGSQDLSVVLNSGGNYYLEVMSGENIGHIFDIESFTANTVTLAEDTDLFAISAPYSTQTTVPADLAGDLFVIREHKTLEGLFPIDDVDTGGTIEGFAAGANASTSGKLLRYDRNGALETYVANSPPGGADTWAATATGPGAPDNILPPGEGIFVHNLFGEASFDILQYGDVRLNQLAVPLKEGYNFVAPGHPIVIQSIDSGDSTSRLMNADGTGGKFVFEGSGARSLADQVQRWQDDTAANAASVELGYDMTFYLRNTSGTVDQWSIGGTPLPTNEEDVPYFEPTRSAMYCLQNGDTLDYYLPSPISNAVN